MIPNDGAKDNELFNAIATAATQHADANGDTTYEVGDFENLFAVAYGLLQPGQREQFWNHPDIAGGILEIQEFSEKVKPLIADYLEDE